MAFAIGETVLCPTIQLFGLPYKQGEKFVGKVLRIEGEGPSARYTTKLQAFGAIGLIPLKYYAHQMAHPTAYVDEPVLSEAEQALLDESNG